MTLAGLANAIFHPADYAILNSTVDSGRIGRAFSLHTFSGNMGDVLAPLTVLALTAECGWRVAIFSCGTFGVIVAALRPAPRQLEPAKYVLGLRRACAGHRIDRAPHWRRAQARSPRSGCTRAAPRLNEQAYAERRGAVNARECYA